MPSWHLELRVRRERLDALHSAPTDVEHPELLERSHRVDALHALIIEPQHLDAEESVELTVGRGREIVVRVETGALSQRALPEFIEPVPPVASVDRSPHIVRIDVSAPDALSSAGER